MVLSKGLKGVNHGLSIKITLLSLSSHQTYGFFLIHIVLIVAWFCSMLIIAFLLFKKLMPIFHQIYL